MSNVINNSKDLGKALKNDQDEIEITADLHNRIVKVKATGKIAWAIAIGAIGVAVVSALSAPPSAGASSPVAVPAGFTGGGVAVTILGLSTTKAAISIAVAGGGVGVLTSLRNKYNMKKLPNGNYLLRKK